MKALRIYYDTTSKIIYNIGLEGTGEFPHTVEEELKGLPAGTQLLEISDAQLANNFLVYEGNSIQDGRLVLGIPIPPVSLPLPQSRNILTEFDTLKQTLIDKRIVSASEIL